MKDLVLNLVRFALRRSVDDLLVIRSQEQLDGALKRDKGSIKLLWMDVPDEQEGHTNEKGDVVFPPRKVGADAIYSFWQLWHNGIFASRSYVIFTTIDESTPLWGDLREYESCRFGSIFLLNYDSTTSPGAKPSQRGMLIK